MMKTPMSKKTINRLTLQLVKELKEHPHKDEIVALATAQLYDDELSNPLV